MNPKSFLYRCNTYVELCFIDSEGFMCSSYMGITRLFFYAHGKTVFFDFQKEI